MDGDLLMVCGTILLTARRELGKKEGDALGKTSPRYKELGSPTNVGLHIEDSYWE